MERLPLRRERAQDNGVTFTWGTVAASTARQHDAYAWAAALGRGLRVRRNSSDVSDTGTTISLLAKPGYPLADLGVAPAGFYGTQGPARARPERHDDGPPHTARCTRDRHCRAEPLARHL